MCYWADKVSPKGVDMAKKGEGKKTVRHFTADEAQALRAVKKWGSAFGFHDIVMWGHHSKKVATKSPRPYFTDEGIMVHRNTVWCVNGSYLKGYMQGHKDGILPGGNYVEKGLYPPVTLGGLILTLRAKPDGTPDVDISL